MNPLMKITALLLTAGALLWMAYGNLKDADTKIADAEKPDIIANTDQSSANSTDDGDGYTDDAGEYSDETEAAVGAYQHSSLVDPGETASVEFTCSIPVLYPGTEDRNPTHPDSWTYQLMSNSRSDFAKAGISINEISISADGAEPEMASIWGVPANATIATISVNLGNLGTISWEDYGDPEYRALNLDGKGIVATGKMDESAVLERFDEIKEAEKNTQVAYVTTNQEWELQEQEVVAAYQLAFSLDMDTPNDYYERFPKDRSYVDNHINDTIEVKTTDPNVLARFGISLALNSYGKGSGAKEGKLSITARCGRF